MLSRPLGAFLAVFVGVAAASAQPVPPPVLPPDALPPVGGVDLGVDPGRLGGGPGPYCWWLSAEYLLGYTTSTDLPPLVTGGPVASGGALGLPGTRVLFGGRQDFDGVSGIQAGGGVWLDPCRAYGLEWSGFYLPRQESRGTFTAAPGELLARPFFDTALNRENSRLIAAPGFFTGRVEAVYASEFWGAEIGGLLRVVETPTFVLEQLYQFRFYTLDESVRTDDTSTALGGGVVAFNGLAFPAPATVSVTDYYSVTNHWYGGSAGLRLIWTPGRWEVRATGRLGVGTSQQTLTVAGGTELTTPAGTASTGPGFYSSAVTRGRVTENRLSFAPDVQVRVGYRVTDWLMVTAGYQYLYISEVARAGDQIDRRLDPGRIPSSQNFGAAAPPVPARPLINSTDFNFHAFTAGLMLTF